MQNEALEHKKQAENNGAYARKFPTIENSQVKQRL